MISRRVPIGFVEQLSVCRGPGEHGAEKMASRGRRCARRVRTTSRERQCIGRPCRRPCRERQCIGRPCRRPGSDTVRGGHAGPPGSDTNPLRADLRPYDLRAGLRVCGADLLADLRADLGAVKPISVADLRAELGARSSDLCGSRSSELISEPISEASDEGGGERAKHGWRLGEVVGS